MQLRLRFGKLGAALAMVCGFALRSGGIANASVPPVVRVEVAAPPAPSVPDVEAIFERIVRRELARQQLPVGARDRRYVLSAKLVRLTTEPEGGSVTASCSVLATLRDHQSGGIRAILRGRARASDARDRADSTRMAAMQAAVHGALAGLERALQ